LNKTFVMVLDSPWQLRYTELNWCRLKVLHWSKNKVHVEGGKIYLLLSRKIMIKMLFIEKRKCILVEAWKVKLCQLWWSHKKPDHTQKSWP
jgi:hypothetical protein